jgi:hypothetical protein
VGYGISESLLERKHPNKFNPWGHTFWAGRIYAPYPFFRLFARPVIYHGLWGSAGYQVIYDKGGMGLLSFLPRAMEWHFFLAAVAVLGCFFPWAWAVVAGGLVYMAGYAVACGKNVNLDVLLAAEPNAGRARRLLWRSVIAWLHFLEPAARDWGRLKGGLTPWRSVAAGGKPRRHASSWWRRLLPIGRTVPWSRRGPMQLDRYAILSLMMRRLAGKGLFVGWNPATEVWDLRAGRGALAESRLNAVVEHHGGPRRLARISAVVGPPSSIRWTLGIVAALTAGLGVSGQAVAAGALGVFGVLLWVATAFEINRLEGVLLATADEVARELTGEERKAAR